MKAQLLSARRLLKGGWVGPAMEPWCRTRTGNMCMEDCEGLALFSVHGALLAAGAWPEGWRLLESLVAPATLDVDQLCADVAAGTATPERIRHLQLLCKEASKEVDLQAWLMKPERTLDDVLRVFDRAVLRSAREKRT